MPRAHLQGMYRRPEWRAGLTGQGQEVPHLFIRLRVLLSPR